MKRYLGILVVLGLFSGVLLGDTYYVNSTIGNDTWDGTAPTYQSGTIGPKATIQAGIDVADCHRRYRYCGSRHLHRHRQS